MKISILYTVILLAISFPTFAQRKVLIEQFTNSGCPPCAGITPVIASYVNANSNDVLMLAYHTSFPYSDSMYFENSFQSNQRVAFYSVAGVSASRVDGNFFTGNLVPTLNTTIPNAGAVAPRYNITFSTSNFNGTTVNASVIFESTDPANTGEPLTAMIVLAEKNVLKSSYVCCAGANTETEYPWVVRRMLPDEIGTTLVNTNLIGTDLVNVTGNTTNIKDYSELRIIAFVQNTATKAVYQAEISTPLNTTGISEIDALSKYLFTIANPVSNNILIHFNSLSTIYNVRITDAFGKLIYHQTVKNSADINIDAAKFKSGVCFIQVANDYAIETKRIVISK